MSAPSEDPLGVIWVGVFWPIHGLVITPTRMIGSTRSPGFTEGICKYLGPGSGATEEDLAEAREVIPKLLEKKDFEILKETITRIGFRAPEALTRGHLHILCDQGTVKFTLPSKSQNGAINKISDPLLHSLAAFAPDRLYDDKTGQLVIKPPHETLTLPGATQQTGSPSTTFTKSNPYTKTQ